MYYNIQKRYEESHLKVDYEKNYLMLQGIVKCFLRMYRLLGEVKLLKEYVEIKFISFLR